MVRKTPRWLPRKSTVIAARTRRVASAPTARVTAKRSMAKERGWASARGARAARRTRTRRRRLIRLAPEGDLRHLPLVGAVQLEVRVGTELEEAGHEVGGEDLDGGVEIAHHRVEVPPGVLYGFLDLAEPGLQRPEAGARLEVWLRLAQREEPAQGLAQLRFTLRARLRRLGGHRRPPRPHHRVEGAVLMGRVSLDRFDEVGHEIGAPLELHVHVGPR